MTSMTNWTITLNKDFSCTTPICIEGLPGIGNVGKIVVDFLIDELKAEKVGSFFSYDLPNSVFVNEDNLVQLPAIELYYKKINNQDFLFLGGDAQPSIERSSYDLSLEIIALLKSFHVKEIITLGGIGLNEIPDEPNLYVTGNDKKFIESFEKQGANPNVHGVVGPIIGVSGLLLGLAAKENIPAAAVLGETFAHPMYIGLKEARILAELLQKTYSFKLDFKQLDEDIDLVNEELLHQGGSVDVDEETKKRLAKFPKFKDTTYIG